MEERLDEISASESAAFSALESRDIYYCCRRRPTRPRRRLWNQSSAAGPATQRSASARFLQLHSDDLS